MSAGCPSPSGPGISLPGSPLEEHDNPYYNYDYGPGVEGEAPHYEGAVEGTDGVAEEPQAHEAPEEEVADPEPRDD